MKRAMEKNKTKNKKKNKRRQSRSAALAIKLVGGGGGGVEGGRAQLVCGRPTLALSSALVPQTISCSVCVDDSWLINALS